MPTEIVIETGDGDLTAVDHGGAGQPVLLVHGSGHNAAAWDAVVPGLLPDHRVVAVDLRGHGHSPAASTAADQYWRDLAVVVATLGWDRPLLIGHSTGGYAVTAVVAAGLVTPAAIGVLDGLVLDDRATTARTLAGVRTPEAADGLRGAFGYGRRFDAAGRDAWIEEQVTRAPDDPLNAGSPPDLVRAVSTRSFLPTPDATPDTTAANDTLTNDPGHPAGRYLRRPAVEEIITTTTAPTDAPVYPSVDVYDRITCPMTIVLPDSGFYAGRRPEVAAVVAAAPHRDLVDLPDAGHNLVMTHPAEVTEIIRSIAARVNPAHAADTVP